jgi:hypothetical protein
MAQGDDVSTHGRDAGIEPRTLRLPAPPAWIDTVDGLEAVRQSLASEPLVAFDAEWTNAKGRDDPSSSAGTVISTLQLAVNEKQCWVIDLLCPRGESDGPYRSLCRELVEALFRSKIMLGFAVGRDLANLEDWLEKPLDRSRCLDLQHCFSPNKSSVPGLASCTHQVLEKIPEARSPDPSSRAYRLDKTQQCSDWDRRPLTSSQLAYAALDAAILPFLLAEQRRIVGTPVATVQRRRSDAEMKGQ